MFDKKAITSVTVNDLIARRWSGRAYDATRLVPEEHIIALLEAARWSPSCFGDQPWHYIICNKHKNPIAWDQAFSCLSEGNQTWAKNAPVLMLSIADSIMSRTGKPNRWGQHDTGAASMSLCIQATELGLMVHQMGGFDVDKSRDLFSVPEQYTPMAMMTIGYQLPLENIDGELKEREIAGRSRKPLNMNFFEGTWGNPYTEIQD